MMDEGQALSLASVELDTERLVRKTKYTKEELQKILRAVGYEFTTHLPKLEFLRVLYKVFKLDPFKESRIVHKLFEVFTANQHGVSYEDYAIGSSVICRGSPEEKTSFTFRLFSMHSSTTSFITLMQFSALWTSLLSNSFFFTLLFQCPPERYLSNPSLILDKLFHQSKGKNKNQSAINNHNNHVVAHSDTNSHSATNGDVTAKNGTQSVEGELRINFEEYSRAILENHLFWHQNNPPTTSTHFKNGVTKSTAPDNQTNSTKISNTSLNSNLVDPHIKPLELQTKWPYVARFLSIYSQPTRILKSTKSTEISFYSSLSTTFPSLLPFVPPFHGIIHTPLSDLILMDDLRSSFSFPIIMDIKMGTCTANQFYSPSKFYSKQINKKRPELISAEKNPQTTFTEQNLYEMSQNLLSEWWKELGRNGFRIISIQIPTFNNESGKGAPKLEYEVYSKGWSRNRSGEERSVERALEMYMGGGMRKGRVRRKEVERVVERLKEIRAWAEKNRELKLISSSLLFMLEGEIGEGEEEGRLEVRVIDFEHVYYCKDGTRDEGFLLGVGRLVEYFTQLLNSIQK